MRVSLSNVVILLAAGSGVRFQAAKPKQYTNIGGTSILNRALRSILNAPSVEIVVIVVSPDHEQYLVENGISHASDSRIKLVHGGTTRGDSIRNALIWVFENLDLDLKTRFLVHDSARAFVSKSLIEKLIDTSSDKDAWIVFQKPVDTIALRKPSGRAEVLVASDGYMALQTPITMSFKAASSIINESNPDLTRGVAAFLIDKGLDVGFIETDGSTRKITYSYDLSYRW